MGMADTGDPRLYVRIAASVRSRIQSGELAPGQAAPSITTLVQEWGVARETAAQAYRVLEAEGLVKRWPGRGYFVVARD